MDYNKEDDKSFTDHSTSAFSAHNVEKGEAAEPGPKKPSLGSRIRHRLDIILPKLAFPVAVLVGCAITAGTTYALVRHVQHLIAHAKVDANPVKWMQEARTRAYDACYYGCNDCSDSDWAYNACNMTSRANVTGITCDGNIMWNWKERYPLECLLAVGEFYKAIALKKLKQSYRNQLAIIILTALAGFLGALITFIYWRSATVKAKQRAEAARQVELTWLKEAISAPVQDAAYPWPKRSKASSIGKKAIFLTALTGLFGRSQAFPCAGYKPNVDQYFLNANNTLFGVVHGWLSDCYTYTCDCTSSCSGVGTGVACSTSCSTCVAARTAPSLYVNKIKPKVAACGFQLVDAVEGNVNLRIANALIERNWWVKISVNQFNVTDETDPSIKCLHDIAN